MLLLGIIIAVGLFFFLKNLLWDSPKDEIRHLSGELYDANSERKKLQKENNALKQTIKANEQLYKATLSDINSSANGQYRSLSMNECLNYNSITAADEIKSRFNEAIKEQYKYRYILSVYPELSSLFNGETVVQKSCKIDTDEIPVRSANLFDTVDFLKRNEKTAKEIILLKNRNSFLEAAGSNLTAIPYMAKIMADYETYGLKHLAKELNWGFSVERRKKVDKILAIHKAAQEMVEKNKEALYQLDYLIHLFPNLSDVIDMDYKELPVVTVKELTDYDAARDWLSKEEYQKLTPCERNQLALDRYKTSHSKTKWQIGRDYELYVGYQYTLRGYTVDYCGSYMGLGDLGRDLIAKKDGHVVIIQCKYWSAQKEIHENHINQLYGTMVCYCIENNIDKSLVEGRLVTNIRLSETAKKMADFLGIRFTENYESGDFPCIKCNINQTSGEKIYHLPFDQQYDSTKIDTPGEFWAVTVEEAEKAGFRRAFKWFGTK